MLPSDPSTSLNRATTAFIQLIHRGIALLVFPGAGRDPFAPYAPAGAFPLAGQRPDPGAGVAGFLMSPLARRSLLNRVNGSEH